MKIVGWIALVFTVLEVAQLIVAQRFIGVEQIRRNLHPLDAAKPRPLWFSAGWVAGLLTDYAFQAALLIVPIPPAATEHPDFIRFAAVLMLIISFGGFALRRSSGVKWGLVVLTIEGALRAGFFFFVFNVIVLHGGTWRYSPYPPPILGPAAHQGAAGAGAPSALSTISGVSTEGSSTGVVFPGR